jgi:hypothetical protein
MIQGLLEKELLRFTMKLENIDGAGTLRCRYRLIVEARVRFTRGFAGRG